MQNMNPTVLQVQMGKYYMLHIKWVKNLLFYKSDMFNKYYLLLNYACCRGTHITLFYLFSYFSYLPSSPLGSTK